MQPLHGTKRFWFQSRGVCGLPADGNGRLNLNRMNGGTFKQWKRNLNRAARAQMRRELAREYGIAFR